MTEIPRADDESEESATPEGWRGLVSVWRHNPLWRKLYAARAISLVGTWFNSLVLVELLAGAAGSVAGETALALAIVFVLKQVPVTLLGPAAGVVADRLDRRRIMLCCEFGAAGLVLAFLLLSPGGPAIWVYLLAAGQMAITAFFLPAYQAMVPSIVRPQDLALVNVISSATWSVTFALGMALGGVVLALAGWRAAVVLDAMTYCVSGLLVLSMHWRQVPRRGGTAGARGLARLLGLPHLRAGLRYILAHTDVRRIILVKFGWGSMGAITLFLALLGRSDFRFGASLSAGVSYLWGCRALGTLFGPFLAYRFGGNDPRRLERTITWSFFLAPGFYFLLAWTTDFWLGGVLVFVAHLAGSILWVISTVLLQQIVPDEYRGRTFAAELGLVMLSSSLSLLVYGASLDFRLLGLRPAIAVASAVCLVPAVCWCRGARRAPDAV